MYGPVTESRNKPLTKCLGPIFQEEWSETTGKLFFMLHFLGKGPFGHPQIDQKRSTNVCK
jgi:hypothetical protein